MSSSTQSRPNLDPHLIDVLVCPLCKSPLHKRLEYGALVCKADRLAYPVRDGIPILLVEHAEPLPDPLIDGNP